MRPPRALTYRIEQLPPVPAVLEFLVEQSGLEPHAAYSTFNMGSGFALYCGPGHSDRLRRAGTRRRPVGAARQGTSRRAPDG